MAPSETAPRVRVAGGGTGGPRFGGGDPRLDARDERRARAR
ncbi:hypothetical protein ACIBFB_00240 [Nocardiopsis sp. NPDC050513]